jgi:hypothetical protein
MRDIIAEAHKARYTVAEDDPKKQGIVISDAWLAESGIRRNYQRG